MVWTRGPKPLFDIGERVLCYEPDPYKMKMLYDAKVMNFRPSQLASPDDKNKKGFDYFVHFQGWSSNWDRFVATDMLLKDNEVNRKEQERLYHLTEDHKRSQEKKRKRKSTDRNRTSIDSNPSPVPSDSSDTKYQAKRIKEERFSFNDDDEIQFNRFRANSRDPMSEPESDSQTEPSNSPKDKELNVEEDKEKDGDPEEGAGEELEDVCTEPVHLNIPAKLKTGLETDLKYISHGKLVKLPAQPNIVFLLEGFVRNFAISKLYALEKQNLKVYNQYRQSDRQESDLFDDVANSINIAKEVAEGCRILVDFHLGNILLYQQEMDQFIVSKGIRPHMENIELLMAGNSPLPHQTPSRANKSANTKKNQSNTTSSDVGGGEEASGSARKRQPRASKKESESEGGAAVPGSVGSVSSGGTETPTLANSSAPAQYPTSKKSHQILQELFSWKLVPESLYFEEPVPASLIYGGVHLARLVVKLPQIFVKMRFPNKKLKHMMKYLEYLLEYISNSEEIFADNVYAKAK
eukprot:TRINITY_DN12552_c0_g1_i1.p1 TRINITY_DN12552_c0_g1~~TRINITY_DN12552_c0_g1_i1.p1  ORF type:complete len:521 (+),score=99.68 TRINITY_DN12552_c0_g1_i1:36-1598(+)